MRTRPRPSPRAGQGGFTLVEIAIVLVIIGLLIGGLVTPLTMQIEQRKQSDTQRQLDEAREALIGFAMRNGYLPCPAISASNGQEDRGAEGRCTNERRVGYLPWATLGLAKLDSWNHLFRYSVTPNFADSVHLFSLQTLRDITVASRDGAGNLVPATASADIPAVVMSHGKNGFGASNDLGGPIIDTSTTNQDEKINANSVNAFIARGPNDNPAAPGGEFDDLVVWVSPNIMFNRMVTAQRLP
jgi:prepilin-type N-terminal cleavage/methylation domain-containing protein